MDLARNEVELINPRVSGGTYALLRSYGLREWRDQRGNWHVVVQARRLPEIEQTELRERRSSGRGPAPAPGHAFRDELARAMARLEKRRGARERE